MTKERLIRGFLFACTNKSEAECLDELVFATEKFYGPVVIRIRRGDLLFLNNINTDTMYGVFKAATNGRINIKQDAFNGRYPYQVKAKPIGETVALPKAKSLISNLNVNRYTPIYGEKLIEFINALTITPGQLNLQGDKEAPIINKPLLRQINRIRDSHAEIDIEDGVPPVEATTFWDFPKQSYGLTSKGNNKYAGVTPALIIYNMVWRYTDPGDRVVDPMCGSGTTIDVCKAEKRKVIGFDISPAHPEVIPSDARDIPLKANSVDMVFIDSPYGDNIKYNDHPGNIGNISSESESFYDELEKVMIECRRILKDGKALGWLIGDQWVRNRFTPVGLRIYEKLCEYFEPLDIVCVARRSQYSHTGVWYNRARRFNFFLRGFKYLIIVRKTTALIKPTDSRKIAWARYKR